MSELRKLRRVLDFVPAAEMKSWKGKEYYEALNRRLHREVLVERPLARPARDEAVRVVDPAEWEAARSARERQLLQENELEHARSELERVLAREDELRREVEAMRGQIAPLRAEAEEKRRVALQLVGVRRAGTPQREPAEDAPVTAPVEEPSPTSATARWEVVGEAAPSPPPAKWEAEPTKPDLSQLEREAAAAEDAIRRVEAEIQKVESELQTLQSQESTLRTKAPLEHEGYTLYRRTVGMGVNARDMYFFSQDKPVAGTPSPLPKGQEVAVGANGLPFLRPAKRAVRTGKGRASSRRRP